MSAAPGKILVDGIATLNGQKVFVLKVIQGREPEWVNRTFFARFDPQATWIDELEPTIRGREFFFAPSLREMAGETSNLDWQDRCIEWGCAVDSRFKKPALCRSPGCSLNHLRTAEPELKKGEKT
jgi:hypothetical protein